ncbi:MAG TPA: hypothetical protein VFU79_05125 [Nitrososphaeraceae archaeon]|nr:hypothetical protein [Nitrososphaeraceae archaeon]
MFSSDVRKEMNRTNSQIILTSIILGAFLVFNTAPLIDVSGYEERFAPDDRPIRDYPPVRDYPPENVFNPDMHYTQDIYGEFSDQHERGYYEDHYGKPYSIK